jgi:hypothetical protein
MAKKPITFDDVAEMAAAFPGVAEGSSYGTRGWKVGKAFLMREKEKMDRVLVLKLANVDEQEFLMESDQDVFFITDHYKGWPAVLIRLAKIDRQALAALIEAAWRRGATKKLIAAYEAA